jgi:hypothetical protein
MCLSPECDSFSLTDEHCAVVELRGLVRELIERDEDQDAYVAEQISDILSRHGVSS